MTALIVALAVLAVTAVLVLAAVARDVAIRAFADRADARTRAVQADEAWRADVTERLKAVQAKVHEHDASLKAPRAVRR